MPAWVVLGPGDDAAVVRPARGALDVLTADVQIEGVHFDRRFVPPPAVGYRALAVSLSDLAAMGARPRAALLSLALPGAMAATELDGIIDGMLDLAGAHQVAIVGGNISRSPGPLVVDVTAVGAVRPRRVLTRAGARPGDDVYVTGTIGAAAAGLGALRMRESGGPAAPVDMGRCEQRFLHPAPRVLAGLHLAGHRAASSCIDLSDGLADGVRQIADASGVGITLDAAALPIDDAARAWFESRGVDVVSAAVGGGDDYELLFTVRQAHRGRLRGAVGRLGNLPVTRIGVVTRSRDLLLRRDGETAPLPAGYEHFR